MYEAFSEERRGGPFGIGHKRTPIGQVTPEHPLVCAIGGSLVALRLNEDDILTIISQGKPLKADFLSDLRRNQHRETRRLDTADSGIATTRGEILLIPENNPALRLRLRNTKRFADEESANRATQIWCKYLCETGNELVI